ncbi:MAG: signal peptidase II [Epulopiscium sp. Nuni2H_MBin001]|nr:MAG: signal peptidase II [Epulopiscium sp. Nuni2H_MBin001]
MAYALPIVILVALDQLIKKWAVTVLSVSGDIPLWPGVFHFSYVENRGAAFGMLQNRQWLFVIITISVLVGIVVYWNHVPKNIYKIALILVISGAVGNLLDRVYLGFVVDMFYFVLIDFPVFNLADVCVVVGTVICCAVMILEDIFKPKED